MDTSKKEIEVLNDLIKINIDRITGYEKAAENVDPAEVMLKTLFFQVAEESHEIKSQLSDKVTSLGGTPANDTTAPGKIYHAWMDIKATFAGDDTGSMLDACEFGEDAAQRAYKEALTSSEEFTADIKHMITSQKNLLKMSHDLIKTQRDQYREMAK